MVATKESEALVRRSRDLVIEVDTTARDLQRQLELLQASAKDNDAFRHVSGRLRPRSSPTRASVSYLPLGAGLLLLLLAVAMTATGAFRSIVVLALAGAWTATTFLLSERVQKIAVSDLVMYQAEAAKAVDRVLERRRDEGGSIAAKVTSAALITAAMAAALHSSRALGHGVGRRSKEKSLAPEEMDRIAEDAIEKVRL